MENNYSSYYSGRDMITPEQLIHRFNLQKHPEGGFFIETTRSNLVVRVESDSHTRRVSYTEIYYLLRNGEPSCFHKLRYDELYHFFSGDDLTIYILDKNGELIVRKLGSDPINHDVEFQTVIPAGCWFAAVAETPDKYKYSFSGCTVIPGFEFSDLEIAKADELAAAYPKHQALIKRLASSESSQVVTS